MVLRFENITYFKKDRVFNYCFLIQGSCQQLFFLYFNRKVVVNLCCNTIDKFDETCG